MKSITVGVALAISALLISSSSASAQRVFAIGVSGGVSFPTGDMADAQRSGYHIGGHLNFNPPALPVELLVDATYHSFEGNLDLPDPIDFSMLGVSASAAYVLPGVALRPYLMGGVGMYFGKADIPGAERESEFGFNVGGGLRFTLSGLSTFVQARANFVDEATFVPVSFGILF
jgi:hypothetical protein